MFGYSALLKGYGMTFTSEGTSGRVIQGDGYLCYNNMIEKFKDDKIFFENENYVIILDGVVLNKKQLLTNREGGKNLINEWTAYIVSQYENAGPVFFDSLRGSFSGLLYDKRKDLFISFTDHLGTKFIYYVKSNGVLFVSSMISECYAFLKQNNISYTLSKENAYLLLTYGYMLEGRTLCDKIHKIEPGCYLTFQNGTVEQHQYCLLNNTPNRTLSESEALEIYDEEFRRAIKLQFDKDEEYGYKHLVALSAGLDSRMVSWVAHDMGYTRQLNATFSQSDYWDEIVPQQIASDLNHDWLFKALDGGWWLENVDDITKITGGNVTYYTVAHSTSLTSLINYNDLGLIHSGQLGDVVFGTHSHYVPYKLGKGAYSEGFLDKLNNIQFQDYPNEEIGLFYTRYLNGTNNGIINNFNNTEFISPWHDIDLLRNVLAIPLEMRFNHNLYFKWILKKYPKAENYVWEKMGTRFNRKLGMIPFSGHKVPIEQIPLKIMGRLGLVKRGTDGRQNMNPYGYYIKTNKELKLWIDNYINNTIDLIEDKEIKVDINRIISSDNSLEKIQALSLLSAIKLYFA